MFDIKEFTYIGTGKHGFSNNDLLMFNCDDENIAIEVADIDFYFIYKTKESSDHDGYFYTITPRYFLFINENKTCLKINNLLNGGFYELRKFILCTWRYFCF